VHGLWLLSSSWQNWRDFFEEHGYATIAPGWPDDPATLVDAYKNPDVFAHKMVQEVTDHCLAAIARLDRTCMTRATFPRPARRCSRRPPPTSTPSAVRRRSIPKTPPAARSSSSRARTTTPPPAITHATHKYLAKHSDTVTEIVDVPERGHSLTIDHGWREVAEIALSFVKRFS